MKLNSDPTTSGSPSASAALATGIDPLLPPLNGFQRCQLRLDAVCGTHRFQFFTSRSFEGELRFPQSSSCRIQLGRSLLYGTLEPADATGKQISLGLEIGEGVGCVTQLGIDPLQAALEFRCLAFRRVRITLELSPLPHHVAFVVFRLF